MLGHATCCRVRPLPSSSRLRVLNRSQISYTKKRRRDNLRVRPLALRHDLQRIFRQRPLAIAVYALSCGDRTRAWAPPAYRARSCRRLGRGMN